MGKINQYRKKPVIIEAIQWTGDNEIQIMDFVGCTLNVEKPPQQIQHLLDPPDSAWQLGIPTLEDGKYGQVAHIASRMDWIIKGVAGEFYPCKPDIFEKTYEKYPDVEKSFPLFPPPKPSHIL